MKETIIDSFLATLEWDPKKTALFFRKGHHFETLSYSDIMRYASCVANYLCGNGVKEGDRIVVISENRPEWVIVDIASLMVGAILVPIHSVLSGVQMGDIIEETKPSAVFVSDTAIYDKVVDFLPSGIAVGSFEEVKNNSKVLFFRNIACQEKPQPFEPVKHDPSRVVTIIYTSGTTGKFKGVMLTNKNIMTNIKDVLTMVDVTKDDRFLSVLPLSHIFERTVGYYLPLLLGSTISYVEDTLRLAEYAVAAKPTIIIAVPRLFEKVYQKVKNTAQKNPVTQLIFEIALKVGNKFDDSTLAYKLADKLVFSKVKTNLGGEIRFFVSGAAPLAPEVGEFFDALKIPVLEGYGLTETAPIISCNTLKKRKYGTVGILLPHVECKIREGELLVRGPSVTSGYYLEPQKTKEAFTSDGWFKTGDLAKINKSGFLTIIAREKEIIALTTGKKVSPAFLEEKINLSKYVENSLVFGDSQKHIGALIYPDKEATRGFTKSKLIKKITEDIEENLNKNVAHYEQVKKLIIISRPFTVDNGLMTPSFKLRRPEILKKYQSKIGAIYKN
jgi:long-chain acyl-CoA synthetase